MVYVRNAWYVAAWKNDIPPTEPFAVTILNQPIVIWRTESGEVFALEDRCVHRLAPLSLGRCEGANLRCMYHGLLFGPDGAAIEIPGQEKISPNAKVRRYAVAEHADWIWIWMGDHSSADLSLLPDAVGPSDPRFMLACGHLDYQAEASLIHDNLLDFSHLAYVHAKSFLATETWARSRMKTTTLERGVRFERWMPGDVPPPYLGGDGRAVDGYLCYEFVIPGVLLMWSGMFEEGTAERCNFSEPNRDKVLFGVTRSSQAVVPTSPGKARYFFNTGPLALPGNEAVRDAMLETTAMAFEEDRIMIEGQQKIIAATSDPVLMPTVHDKGLTIYNRLVERLVKEENQGSVSAA